MFYPFYFTIASIGFLPLVFFVWFVLWYNEFIKSQPSWGVFVLSLWVGAFFSMEKWRERQGEKVKSWTNWKAQSYFGDALSYVGFSFVVCYVAWALLWKYHMVSSPPTGGWWNWAIFLFGFLALLHSFKREVVARENAAGIGSYRVDYGREAALGVLDGAWIFGVVWQLGLNTTAPELFKWMAALSVISGGFAGIVRHAGIQRDYPLAIVDDVMNGVIGGAIAGALLYVLWTIATRSVFVNGSFYVWLFVGAVVGAILNYFRKNGAVTGEGAFSRLLGIAAGGALRGKGLAAGLFFGAMTGFVILWLFVPILLETLNTRPVDAVLLIVSAAGTAVGGYFFLGRGLGGIREALGFSRLGTDTHGDARLATARELREGRLIPRGGGIYLGRHLGEGAERDAVGYPGGVHLLTIGPPGSGKGTGVIIPNLATLRRSILIIDPKGEAAAVTARKRAQFGRVVIINPFEVLTEECPYLKSNGFNPLAALDPAHGNFTDDCKSIAEALVKEQTGGNAEFFSGSAQDLVSALVMHEKLERGENADLGHVRTLLSEPFTQDDDGPLGLQKTIVEMTLSKFDPLRQKAGRFARANKTTFDIIATAANETSFLDSPAMTRDLAGEAFDWNTMKREITTVYLILPADRLETHANYLRLVVTSALRTLLRSRPSPTLPPVLFMLDEFAQLKYLPSIEHAMGIARGFGVQLWPFLQDLNQLNSLYKDRWQSFMANSAVLTAFAPRDMFTARYLSERCGHKTIIVESENERTSGSGMGRSRGPQGVPLFRPEALMEMPAGQMLCFADPVKKPFMTMARGYWETVFREGLDPNPYSSGP